MANTDCPGALSLELPFMDQAHAEFTGLLQRVDQADDAQLPDAWRDVVAVAEKRFAIEDGWMHDTAFASRRGHALQHRVVLEVMRDGIRQAREGRLPQVRQMAAQFSDWYHKHVQSLDAALALHLRGRGFDPAGGATQALKA